MSDSLVTLDTSIRIKFSYEFKSAIVFVWIGRLLLWGEYVARRVYLPVTEVLSGTSNLYAYVRKG